MKVQVDKEGEGIIRGLCDMALKVGGMSNIVLVNKVLHSMEMIVPVVPEPEPKPEESIDE